MSEDLESPEALRRQTIRLTALGLLCGIGLSVRVWSPARAFPLLAVTAVPVLGAQLLLLLLLFLPVLLVMRPSSRLALVLTPMVLFGAMLLDVTRTQPWAYQYALMLFVLVAGKDDESRFSLEGCRLIIAALYFWSGVHKINIGFLAQMVPWLAQPLLERYPGAERAVIIAGMFAPFIEVAIGAALLSPRTQRWGAALAVLMHLGILLAIGPLGRSWNAVVWPWNLVMMTLCVTLFRGDRPVMSVNVLFRRPMILAPLTLAALFPALSFVDLWPSYFSWALYSSDVTSGEISVRVPAGGMLPRELSEALIEDSEGISRIDPVRWSVNTTGVPLPPETSVYENLGRYVCRTFPELEPELVIRPRPPRFKFRGEEYRLTCRELR